MITCKRLGRGARVDQRVSRLAGSASMSMTSVVSASSVPRMIADVVLPAPPLEVANDMTGMGNLLQKIYAYMVYRYFYLEQ